MPGGLTGGDTFHLMKLVLDLRQTNHERVAENIAQQDTPGYKARRFEFQDALRQASGVSANLAMKATQPSHLGPAATGNPYAGITGTESVVTTGAKQDGNTVAPEEEMARMAENTLMYDAATQIVAAKFRGLRGIIREGR